MKRLGVIAITLAWLTVIGLAVWFRLTSKGISWPRTSHAVQQTLADELKTVTLTNCTLKRYGSPYSGGYLMCANLLDGIEGAYSYGIDREDNWGCHVSTALGVTVHQVRLLHKRATHLSWRDVHVP